MAVAVVAVLLTRVRLEAAGGQRPPQRGDSRRLQRPPRLPTQREAPKPQPSPQPSPEQPTAPASGQPAEVPSQRSGIGFRLENADLLQFISLVATQLKMNYVVDPAVKGVVTINTAGDLRNEDLLPILETVLSINGATAVPTGNFYRIMPLAKAAKSPLEILSDTTAEKTFPKDDRMVMEIIPLKFVFAADMSKMLTPFLSDGGTVAVHDAGNILILVDNSLNVKRLMDILTQFDNPSFAQQRVRLISVHNNVASALVPELESIFSAYALSAKSSPLRFVPLDRINGVLVVAADPGAFEEVEKWVEKLDQPAAPSGIQTFVYRVQNSEAAYLARLLLRIRGATPSSVGLPGGQSGEAGAAGGALLPGTGLGTGAGRERERGPGMGLGRGAEASSFSSTRATGTQGGLGLGMEFEQNEQTADNVRIITDPVNNSLIIESTPAQYAEIAKTLKDIDVVPRQVLIEARVYEVTLTGDLSFGLEYFLEERSNKERKPLGSFTAAHALQASAGVLVGHTRELLAFLNASENRSRVRVLSAPSVLATDNSEAKIQVGSEVPILTSQAVVGGVQVGSNSVFTNTIQNRDTGIILAVTPRITSTGLVSLEIAQEISNEQQTPATGIQSPSFSKRSIRTHALVQDAETIALGGLISYSSSTSRNRVPLLGDIPGLGVLFGSTSYTRQETELMVLLTPRIIKNSQAGRDATGELRDKLSDLRHAFKHDQLVNP